MARTLIRVLDAHDAATFKALRLAALAECPTAFASSVDDEVHQSLDEIAQRLVPTRDRWILGAERNGRLIGMAGLAREDARKLAHKAVLWGVYVASAARRSGVGRELVSVALARAASMPGLRQINLGVNVANAAAIALYESFGFRRFGTEKAFMLTDDGVEHDEHHMALVISRGR